MRLVDIFWCDDSCRVIKECLDGPIYVRDLFEWDEHVGHGSSQVSQVLAHGVEKVFTGVH